jgi:hypothetical protein
MMPYTNVDIFREKGLKVFQKSLGATEFYGKKMAQKKHSSLFCCHEFKIKSL